MTPTNRASEPLAGEIAGSALGGGIAAALAAIAGGVVDSAITGSIGSALTHLLSRVGGDVGQRLLSPREDLRVGKALFYAVQKARENEAEGRELRSDETFSEALGSAFAADEIVEALLLTVQRTYEERKIPFMTYLSVNLAYRPEIGIAEAHALLRLAEGMTFRQCCLACVMSNRSLWSFELPPESASGIVASIYHEIVLLGLSGVFIDEAYGAAILGGTYPGARVSLSAIGLKLCKLMELNRIEVDEQKLVASTLELMMRTDPPEGRPQRASSKM